MNSAYRNIGILYTGFVILFLYADTNAQFSAQAGYSLFYSDNPLHNPDSTEEFVNTYLLQLAYEYPNTSLGTSYELEFNDFRNLTDRSNYVNTFGLDYSFRMLDTTDEDNVYAGVSYSHKSGSSGESTYNYDQLNARTSARFPLAANAIITGGLEYSYRYYSGLDDLTHSEISGFLKASVFFKTNTALHFGISAGRKAYSMKDTITYTSYGQGRYGSVSTLKEYEKSTSVTQLQFMLKASQSLLENTGLNAYYTYRNSINNNSSISVSEFLYSDDDDLWDDPYGFDGHDIGAQLTQLLPWDMTFKIRAEYSSREYLENIADTTGMITRNDNRRELWAGLTKEFYDLPYLEAIGLSFEYMHISNSSNSEFLSYKNDMAFFRLKISF